MISVKNGHYWLFPQNIRDYCINAFDEWKRPTVLHFPLLVACGSLI